MVSPGKLSDESQPVPPRFIKAYFSLGVKKHLADLLFNSDFEHLGRDHKRRMERLTVTPRDIRFYGAHTQLVRNPRIRAAAHEVESEAHYPAQKDIHISAPYYSIMRSHRG